MLCVEILTNCIIEYFQNKKTPIELAFQFGNENIVKLLLENNCDLKFYNVSFVDNTYI